MPTMFDGSIDT